MMKQILTSLFVLIYFSCVTSAAIGNWHMYAPYRYATSCEVANDKVYILGEGTLYSYGKEDNELRTYDHIETLNDVGIAFIKYCDEIDALTIIYENADIDLLYDDESVYNISDFKNKTLTSKKIKNLQIYGSEAYISTDFGVVTLNLEKKEFGNTYNLGLDVNCCTRYGDYLYVGTTEGLYKGCLSDNLLNSKNWSKLFDYPITALERYDDKFFCILPQFGLYNMDDNGRLYLLIRNNGEAFSYLNIGKNKMSAGASTKVYIYDSATDYKFYQLDGNVYYLREDGNYIWSCNGVHGLSRLAEENGKLLEKSIDIHPDSPVRKHCEYMNFSYTGKLLVAGGNLNYFDITFYDGTAMAYDGNKWLNFQEEEIKEATGLYYRNITSIAEDPLEEGHFFASSFGFGLYEFRNGEFIKHYNHENSPLESVNNGMYISRYVRVPRLKYDSSGNLWMTNTGTKEIIKILKSDGTWTSLHYSEIAKYPTMVEILFDSRDWLWITSLQAKAGLFCAKQNGTPLDTSDDETKLITGKIKNQDGESYEINIVYALTEDRNGQMWIGTDAGLFVLTNPKKFFDDNVTFTQIKVPRNDGTGLADYLLNGTHIQTICVDGANRKWIGTQSDGLYLVSSDGLETIHHFTTENSYLPSNNVSSIAIEETSGEVFIGTDNGIISYMSDATEPSPVLKENSLRVYPNPVRENHTGNVAISGFTENCNVKITDSAGTLIYETESTGGQVIWDTCNMSGERVSAGVYYVFGYDETGDKGAATKILIIR